MKQHFHSNGKLLLTGEYVVLDGATALAIPTSYGQSLHIEKRDHSTIRWESNTNEGAIWFKATIGISANSITIIDSTNKEIATALLAILTEAKRCNPNFLENSGFNVTTRLDFPQSWGLGSSSTLINNIAQWAEIDAFELLQNSFGGSGYDIAAAQHNTPIFYERSVPPKVTNVHLPWDFKDALFFVHLNQKQDSKEGIKRYSSTVVSEQVIQEISDLSKKLLLCYSVTDFSAILNRHETLISEVITLPTVKERLFSDYPNAIKSLGAWGGDFILCIGDKDHQEYFRRKGYTTIVNYEDMVTS